MHGIGLLGLPLSGQAGPGDATIPAASAAPYWISGRSLAGGTIIAAVAVVAPASSACASVPAHASPAAAPANMDKTVILSSPTALGSIHRGRRTRTLTARGR